MLLGNSFPTAHTQPHTPFLFRKRLEKIDWRRLDVNRVASQIDVETLQEILTSVAFCDINSEIDTRYVDANYIKLFQLAQLLVEYLLYSQDYLTTSMNSLKEENDKMKQEFTQMQHQLMEKTSRLKAVRRECHRRRLLLLAQQQLMDSGPQSYHRCIYCPKAFLNASFLAAHVHRRHQGMEPSIQVQQQVPSNILTMDSVLTQNNNMSASLEKDVRDLIMQLRSTTNAIQRSRPNSPQKQVQFEGQIHPDFMHNRSGDQTAVSIPVEVSLMAGMAKHDWQTVMKEEHRRDIELLRMTFEKELKQLQSQNAATRVEMSELKSKKMMGSNLGEMMDDVPMTSPHRQVRPIDRIELAYKTKSPDDEGDGKSNKATSQPRYLTASPPPIDTYDSRAPRAAKCSPSTRTPHPHLSLSGSCGSLHVIAEPIRVLVDQISSRTASLERTRQLASRTTFHEESDNEDAESDITMPKPVRMHKERSRSPVQRDRPCQWDDTGVPIMNNGATNIKQPRVARQKIRRVKKRVRSTAIQVGSGRHTDPSTSNERRCTPRRTPSDNPVFLKVKRLRSQSGSSTASRQSLSPKSRRCLLNRSRLSGSREIVIVRTDDEEFAAEIDIEEMFDRTRSIHLMPLVGRGTYGKVPSPMHRERIPLAGASARLPGPVIASSIGSQQFVQVVDNDLATNTSKSSVQTAYCDQLNGGKVQSAASLRSASISDRASQSISIHGPPPHLRKARELLDDDDDFDDEDDDGDNGQVHSSGFPIEGRGEETEEHQVSRAMDNMLTHSGASSPTHSLQLSTNVLRYSRLLDQLRADPETLKGLRHEVEQLLQEQLTDRGVGAKQMRLTTTELNNHLAALRRDRERLSKKHPNFMEIREALSRQVDRLAHAALSGSQHIRRFTGSSEDRGLQPALHQSNPNLPPPAINHHSPNTARRAGTLPNTKGSSVSLQSPLGYSMPTLTGRNGTGVNTGQQQYQQQYRSSSNSPHRPPFQRSSPQLNMRHSNEDPHVSSLSPGPRSVSTEAVGSRRTSHTTVIYSPQAGTSSPRHLQSGKQSITTSAGDVQGSPQVMFSHDQKVVTFGNKAMDKDAHLIGSSSDEWDSEPDEPRPVVGGSAGSMRSPAAHRTQPNSASIADDLDVDLDAADAYLANLGRRQHEQHNTNAPHPMGNQANAGPMLSKVHSIRTDDEDMCSVSSINGGAPDDISLSMYPTSSRRNSGVDLGEHAGIRHSLDDPSVASIRAQIANIGPRPSTRYGNSSAATRGMPRRQITSLGSPDLTNTNATSLWGTNSKGVSLSTNVNTATKSDNAYEDFESDD